MSVVTDSATISPACTKLDKAETKDDKAKDRVVIKARRSQDASCFGSHVLTVAETVDTDDLTTEREDEPKRKREGSEENVTNGSESKETEGQAKEKSEEPFLVIPTEDIPAPKRNQIKEQHKCQVEYKTPAQTDFSEQSEGPVTFTANKPSSPVKVRPPQRRRSRKSSSEDTELASSPSKLKSQLPAENKSLRTPTKSGHQKLETTLEKCTTELKDCKLEQDTKK